MKITRQIAIGPDGGRTSTTFMPDGRLVVAQDYGETPRLTLFVEGNPAREIDQALDKALINRRMLPHVEAAKTLFLSYKAGTKGMPKKNEKYRGVWLCKISPAGTPKIVQALGTTFGNGQVQPTLAGCMVMGRGGGWVDYDADLNEKGSGTFNMGDSGEKCQWRKDVAGQIHTMMNGYHGHSSRYNSSYLIAAGLEPLIVFPEPLFTAQGNDLCHPGLGVDRVNPKRAYIGSVFGNVACLRIITARMKATSVTRFDAAFESRHGPQMIPRPSGGCLCLFRRGFTIFGVTAAAGRNKWGTPVALCGGELASGAFSPTTGRLTICAQSGSGLVRYDFD